MTPLSDKVKDYLKGKRFGKLATIMKDGSPQVTPIWYMLEGEKLIINTTTDRVKYHNIRRDPRVAFLVDSGYPYVLIMGKARVAGERDPKKDIETLAIRYTGKKAGTKAARDRYWKMPRVSIEIIPDKVVVDL